MSEPNTIWKFPLQLLDGQLIDMPRGAEILSAQVQHDTLCLWARVDPNAEPEPRGIRIFGTGHMMPDEPGAFIDTVQMSGGALIFHVYECEAPNMERAR